MQLTSTAFEEGEAIPSKYTCDGENINPPLTISSVPAGIISFVLIVEDPDSPHGNFTHWVVYNIPGSMLQILENSIPQHAQQGKNDFGDMVYGGPCPGKGTHRYAFTVYALDIKLELPEAPSKQMVVEKIDTHIIAQASLTGTYVRT